MYFNPVRVFGACLIIFTNSSLYSSQAQNSSQIYKATDSQSSSSASSFSAPVVGLQKSHKQKAQQLTQLFQEFVSHDDADLFDLGTKAEDAGYIELALSYYRQAAADGNEGALYHLPEFYEKYKTMIPHALIRRLQCLIQIRAFSEVAQCYEIGYGVEKDLVRAFEWYKKAADDGDGKACYKTGLGYEQGISYKDRTIEVNEEKAFRYFKKAADHFIESAEWVAKTAQKVAECYKVGYGTVKNPEAALYYETLATKASQLSQH